MSKLTITLEIPNGDAGLALFKAIQELVQEEAGPLSASTESLKVKPATPDSLDEALKGDGVEEKPKRTKKPKEASNKQAADEGPLWSTSDTNPEEKTVSLTDVRAVAVKLSKAGKSDEIKKAIQSLGAKALSEVPVSKLPELLEMLEALNE